MTTTTLAADMNRGQLVDYLKAADAYQGHSRDGIGDLRVTVTHMQGAETEVQAHHPDPATMAQLAQVEYKDIKAWKKAGSKGVAPTTPNLDQLNKENAAGITAKDRKANGKGAKAKPAQTVRFFRDGKPVKDSSNKVSCLAYQYTRGVDGDRARISTDELKALLSDAGIDDLGTTAWEHKLPNGVTIGAMKEG